MLINSLRNGLKIYVHELIHRNSLGTRFDSGECFFFIFRLLSLGIRKCKKSDLELHPKQAVYLRVTFKVLFGIDQIRKQILD